MDSNSKLPALGAEDFPGLGAALRAVRCARKKSVTEWAELIDVSPGTITKYEQGDLRVPIEFIERLATAIHVSPDVVLVYMLKKRYPRLASKDSKFAELVDKFADNIDSRIKS